MRILPKYALKIRKSFPSFQLKGVGSSDEAKQEREELLDKIHLYSKAKARSKTLSGGQKHKLSLGISMIGNAKVVFLDEPSRYFCAVCN
jgi:ABC-type multidrug transport system ATPase subunit